MDAALRNDSRLPLSRYGRFAFNNFKWLDHQSDDPDA